MITEIIVLSGKGGTGKSSVTSALATLCNKIVVGDCDVDAANLYLVLKPDDKKEEVFLAGEKAVVDVDKCTGCGLCSEYCRFSAIHMEEGHAVISESACDGCRLCTRVCPSGAIAMKEMDKSRWFCGDLKNGKMIHARLAPGEDNSGKLVSVVREEARKEAEKAGADVILLDGPPGIGCPVISSITGTSKTLVVTEPTNSGWHDLERIVGLAADFEVPVDVVINKYDLNERLSEEIEKWCNSRKIPVIGKIVFDKSVVDAMTDCETITDREPNSPVSMEIKKIAGKLFPKEILNF